MYIHTYTRGKRELKPYKNSCCFFLFFSMCAAKLSERGRENESQKERVGNLQKHRTHITELPQRRSCDLCCAYSRQQNMRRVAENRKHKAGSNNNNNNRNEVKQKQKHTKYFCFCLQTLYSFFFAALLAICSMIWMLLLVYSFWAAVKSGAAVR